MSAPSKVEEIWLAELSYAHEQEPGGVLTLTMHPEAIGRGSRLAMLERFILAARELPGVARFALKSHFATGGGLRQRVVPDRRG